MRRATIGLSVVMVILLMAAAAWSADYIGATKCKMCHKVEFESWQGLAHAKAFEQLDEGEQSDGECLNCHATGGAAELPGVQCEACHGPGSDYKSMKIMKDQEASIAAGLVIPDEATCKGCHEGAPHEQKPFDYASAKTRGMHDKKQK
jgi:nitrate/TMAO reductase-like tetraheme cytochrome c subunit